MYIIYIITYRVVWRFFPVFAYRLDVRSQWLALYNMLCTPPPAVSYNPFFRSDGFRFVAGGKPLWVGGLAGGGGNALIYMYYTAHGLTIAPCERNPAGDEKLRRTHTQMYMHNFSRARFSIAVFDFFFLIARMPGNLRWLHDIIIIIYSYRHLLQYIRQRIMYA